MSIVSDYLAKVSDAVKWALEDSTIAGILADQGGITAGELQALQSLIAPAVAADEQSTAADGEQTRATQTFNSAFAVVEKELSALRRIMNDNLKRTDPLFGQLGLNQKQPLKQDEFLSYAEAAFTNGQALTTEQGAVLAKRKWDAPRFQSALAKVQAAQAANDAQAGAISASEAATSNLYDQIDALDEPYRSIAKDARAHLKNVSGALNKMQLAQGVPTKPQRPKPAAARKTKAKTPPPA
jgi:hypothetical protein